MYTGKYTLVTHHLSGEPGEQTLFIVYFSEQPAGQHAYSAQVIAFGTDEILFCESGSSLPFLHQRIEAMLSVLGYHILLQPLPGVLVRQHESGRSA